MISVVEQGGFQFAVKEGDIIAVPSIAADAGSEILVDRVLLVKDGDAVKIGTPLVEGAEVRAKVIGHGKGEKVHILKKVKRKDYKRKTGHRQQFTKIQVVSIKG
jgi:large subunit ribosomal protein L21